MGILLFLLSWPAAILVWVYLAKFYRKKNYNKLISHFAGAAGGLLVWIIVVLIGISVDGGLSSESKATGQTEAGHVNKSQEEHVTSIVAAKPLLDLTPSEFSARANTNLKITDSKFKINSNLKVENGVANDTFSYSLDDNLGVIGVVDKASTKLSELSIVWQPTGGVTALEHIMAIAAILSAVDGDDSMKTVGKDVILKTTALLDKWSDDKNESQHDQFIMNDIKYGMTITPNVGVMYHASPLK